MQPDLTVIVHYLPISSLYGVRFKTAMADSGMSKVDRVRADLYGPGKASAIATLGLARGEVSDGGGVGPVGIT